MWTRRSEHEIQIVDRESERKRRSFVKPLVWAVSLALLCTVLYSWGYRGGITRGVVIYSDPTPIFETKSIFIAVFTFLVLYGLMLFHQRHGFGVFAADDILFCADCQEPSHANHERQCECGGTQEPFSHFTWEEDLEVKEMATR